MMDAMNVAALRHTPLSEDAHALREGVAVLRLRTARGDFARVTLCYGDRACRDNPVPMHEAAMRIAGRDAWCDYYEVVLESPYERLCYAFLLENAHGRWYYYADRLHDTLSQERSYYYQLPFLHRADIATVPDWVHDAVVYNIFVDSYASAKGEIVPCAGPKPHGGIPCHGQNGGTLRGILDNLDEIAGLGFNCIYLNPIFAAEAYHKYDTIDYYHVDPVFGTDDDFRALVDACHAWGMRIVVDGVFNHVGRHFFAFEDVLQNGLASRYAGWFYHLEEPVVYPPCWEEYPTYTCFGYERHMPKLDTGNPEVAAYFCDVGRHWLREYGIDGWRLDVASEVNDGFWRAFRAAAKAENPDCLLIGEVWESAQHWLDGSQFDSTMNYDLRRHCRAFFAEEAIDAATFDGLVTQMRLRYRKQMLPAQLNLLDSHDVSRFLTLCGGDPRRMRLALLFQMTFVGMPCVFYGDERGLTGEKEADYRRPMDWINTPGTLHGFYREVIALRRQEAALQRGEYETVRADVQSRLYVYRRRLGNEAVTIALHSSEGNVDYTPPGHTILLSQGYAAGRVGPYGFAVSKGG